MRRRVLHVVLLCVALLLQASTIAYRHGHAPVPDASSCLRAQAAAATSDEATAARNKGSFGRRAHAMCATCATNPQFPRAEARSARRQNQLRGLRLPRRARMQGGTATRSRSFRARSPRSMIRSLSSKQRSMAIQSTQYGISTASGRTTGGTSSPGWKNSATTFKPESAPFRTKRVAAAFPQINFRNAKLRSAAGWVSFR